MVAGLVKQPLQHPLDFGPDVRVGNTILYSSLRANTSIFWYHDISRLFDTTRNCSQSCRMLENKTINLAARQHHSQLK